VIVIVHGYEGSGDGHWQRLLARDLAARDVRHAFPQLSNPLEPQRDQWISELAKVIADSGGEPITFVAHSLGCWAVDHYVSEHGADDVRAALLVAPPSPYLLFEAVQSFMPPPMSTDAWKPIASRSVLVAADDDDYASSDEHAEIAKALGLEHRIVRGGGHLNTDAGFGPWSLPLQWLESIGAVPR